MKKLLALLLALLMITSVTLISCQDKEPNNDGDNWDDGEYNDVSSSDDDSSGSGTGTGNNTNLGNGWNAAEGTVYVMHPTYLRYSASSSDKSSIVVNFGQAMTSISTNGTWTKVSYNEAEYYLYSYLVTANKGDVTFTDIAATATKIVNKDTTGSNPTQTNLRTTPCYDEDLANLGASALTQAMTSNGELHVTGINETKTWARVTFKGKDARGQDIDGTFYCRPSFLEYFQTQTGGNSGGNAGGANPV